MLGKLLTAFYVFPDIRIIIPGGVISVTTMKTFIAILAITCGLRLRKSSPPALC